jgi:DNA-binding MarR family transcriptional regulator
MNGYRMDDDDCYDVWRDMLARVSPARFIDLVLDRGGVRLNQALCRYLVYIHLHEPIGVLDLSELVEDNHPKVSRTLARLEHLGLVQRGESPDDRRIKSASLAPRGRQVVESIDRGRRRVLEEAFADWSQRDRASLARLTRRFSNNVQALIDALPDGDRRLD